MNLTHPLDRPVWNMLTGPQAGLALGDRQAVRIDPGFGPFAAVCDQGDEAMATLAALFEPGEQLWMVEPEEWPVPSGMVLVRTAPLVQMLAESPCAMTGEDPGIEQLDATDAAEMAALALATEPGPWGERTRLYGTFYGIRREGRLAAMAGERMRPGEGFAEVSGVCTWPEFRGKGFAARLIGKVMAGLTARGDVPFLHSYAGNSGAIALYESLGFRIRRNMVVTVLERR